MTTRFVAIGVAPTVRAAVDAAITPVRDVRPGYTWTDPLGWHVTLAFLGDRPDDAVTRIAAAVERAVTAAESETPWRLTVGGAGRFGGRVLVARVEDDPPGGVADLGEQVQAALSVAGEPVQLRRVRPHLTLARARREPVDDALVAAAQQGFDALPGERTWQVTQVGVWSSHPRRGRPASYVVDAEVLRPG